MSEAKAKQELDLTVIAKLYAKGKSLADIATQLEGDIFEIAKHLRVIRQEKLALSPDERKTHIERELEKINALELAYHEGYVRSCRPLEKKKTSGEVGGEQKKAHRASREEMQRDGDPRWLDGEARCVLMRCKLLGLPT